MVLRYEAFLILFIGLLGLVPICRGGRWNWRVVRHNGALNVLFWVGWASACVVGVLTLFGVA